ncbi:hypothetical protein [Rhizobium sp. 18065]|uniref:portal protein n=1 Tax=Rhizobium sp. 18065 TaxID=2681411 RepID=UPI00135B6F7A|nr:hypothetical protein [Rhizobium sp. 18065]
MFDLNADDGSVQKKKYKSPIPDTKLAVRPMTGNRLDSQPMQRLHLRLLDTWQREADRQAPNRRDQAIDEDMYDNIQYDPDDEQTLRDRGQMPLVFNVTATTLDWVIGSEKRSRTDFKVLPRRKQDGEPARRKSELLKYLSDVNRTPFEVSRSFEDAAKIGVGWMEDAWRGDDEGEPIYSGYESWRNMLWDSTAIKMDLEDGRFVGRNKWIDLDVACAIFRKRKSLLRRSVDEGNNLMASDAYGDFVMDQLELESQSRGESGSTSDRVTGYQRQRVRIIEMWFRMPVNAPRLSGGMFSGEIYDEFSEGHIEAVDSGEAEIIIKPMMRTYVALMTTVGLLWVSESPYRHNRWPFTPIWNKRRGRDLMPYGIIRNIRDIQRDINKRASKALHIISTSKVIMDAGAVEDLDAFTEEVARPDAVIVKNKGFELKIDADRELSQYHLEMMSRNIQMLQQVGGVTDENLGRSTNAVSGVAIQARQEQGALATAKLFDNHRFAQQVRGEKLLSIMEQYMSSEKQFRITNQRGSAEYITINDGLPDNDIVRTKADFVISEEDHRASVRQAQVAELLDLLGKLAPLAPQVVMVSLDLIVESMDIPQRDELVKRIRQVTGMSDPDAEEEDQETQDRKKAAEQQNQLSIQQVMAQLKLLVANAAKSEAQAEEIRSKIAKNNIETQRTALDAAGTVAAIPAVADVADHLLHESGFVSRTEAEEMMRAAAEQQAAQAAQMQQQAPQGQPPAANQNQIGLG